MKKKMILLALPLLILGAAAAYLLYGDAIYAHLNPVRNDWVRDETTGRTYYLDEDSAPATGWFEENGTRYYLDPAQGGARASGWMEIDGKTYYFLEDGSAAAGWQTLEGTRYYFGPDGARFSGWLEEDGTRRYLSEEGTLSQGWLELEDGTYYLDGEGIPHTGWMEIDGARRYLDREGRLYQGWLTQSDGMYYLDEQGIPVTGWLELEGARYYLKEDGTAARGTLSIGGVNCFFSSTGVNLFMVNRWNPVPEDYQVELATLPNGREIAAECYEALIQMIADCEAAGCHPDIIGANRTNGSQRALFYGRVAEYEAAGHDRGTAYGMAAQWVAVPGTSEHELGLALDIVDKYPNAQSAINAQNWLNEHCWDYGFIVRYPSGKAAVTGINSEPWHYRYVGLDLAMELKDSGLCLEEYLDRLTDDGTTCGNPRALNNG